MKKIITVLIISVLPAVCLAQSNLSICYNTKNKVLSADKTCSTKDTVKLNGSNFASTLGIRTTGATGTPTPTPSSGSINYSKCYKQAGSAQGARSDGTVGVAVSCKTKTDVMISSGFTTTDNSDAFPQLSNQTLILNGSIPNGVQMEATGEANLFYKIDVTIVCCPKA